MYLQQFIEESTTKYKDPSMLLLMPPSIWKTQIHLPNFELDIVKFPDEEILEMFLENSKTTAIVIAGDEPMDSLVELRSFIFSARKFFKPGTRPIIVIYTNYFFDELRKLSSWTGLKCEFLQYGNILLKSGRPYKTKTNRFNADLGLMIDKSQTTIRYCGHQYD